MVKNIKKKIKRFFKKDKPGMWQGNFQNWQIAQENSIGYNETSILEKCKSALLKVKNHEAVYERDSVLFDKIQYSWALLSCLQKVAIENNNNLSVLDFGGSLGSTYYQNKTFLENLNSIEWSIVEQTHFVSCGKDFFENNTLKFYNNIDDCLKNRKPNVLLLSSVLQYLENPQQWINQFCKLEIPYILIDRTAISSLENDIITIQNVKEEIYKASYPCRFFNEKKLLNLFQNYHQIAEFDSFCDFPKTINKDVEVCWKGYLLKLK